MFARLKASHTDPTEQWVHHHAGLVSSGSGSYIDSVILRDRDTTGNGTLDERVYYLQNWRADVVALITDAGAQVEQVRYEPYGSPFGIPAGDVDASGAVEQADQDAVTAWWSGGGYDVRGDVDMDGLITLTDVTLVAAAKAAGDSLGLYQLSTVDNRKGYAGYELLAELSEAKWDVRNRMLNSRLGRWNRRDSARSGVNGLGYQLPQRLPFTTRERQSCGSQRSEDDTPTCAQQCRDTCDAFHQNPEGFQPFGFTTCCGQQPMICICTQIIEDRYGPGQDGVERISECVRYHEECHVASLVRRDACQYCPDEDSMCTPDELSHCDNVCEEVRCYQATVLCLGQMFRTCPDADCEDQVLRAIRDAVDMAQRKMRECRACNGNPGRFPQYPFEPAISPTIRPIIIQ